MASRLFAVVAGSVVTFGLFFMMQALIASGQSAMSKAVEGRVVDFVRVQREETVERRQSKPKRPTNPEAPPPDAPQPSIDQSADVAGTALAVADSQPVQVGQLGLGLELGTGFTGSVDGDYVPLVRVQPDYPRRARDRNIEGWVMLELTVTESGGVKDVRVIESHPSEIFNRCAIKAAQKFKYKPRVVNGKPIQVRGVRYRMTFLLVDE